MNVFLVSKADVGGNVSESIGRVRRPDCVDGRLAVFVDRDRALNCGTEEVLDDPKSPRQSAETRPRRWRC